MFDQLFERPHALARHRAGPLLKERTSFLTHLAARGMPRITLRCTAQRLLVIANALGLASRTGKTITRDKIKRTANGDAVFVSIATRWLQFLGRLQSRPSPVCPHAKKIKSFADYLEHERGLASATIRGCCWIVPRLLSQLNTADGSLREITPDRIDRALQELLEKGKYSRVSVQGWASRLRSFFRFAELRGWCRKGLANSIRGPRVYSQASLPVGPSWDDVRRMLAMTDGNRPVKIRDHAILMLLAIYGLRAGEVSQLRLDDFDWERERLTVEGSKTQRTRTWPLSRAAGDAVLRYLKEVRPHSSHREVFLTVHAPFRPMRNLWGLVAKRLRSLDLSLPHHGPHALRHACATRLLNRGLSLKEIGDQLGHQDPDTTRIYAKVDLVGLREVADFDLGRLGGPR
jgi:integrase/recombinase XerD